MPALPVIHGDVRSVELRPLRRLSGQLLMPSGCALLVTWLLLMLAIAVFNNT